MSSANVIPSAPSAHSNIGEEQVETQPYQHLYPVLNSEQETFRLNKIAEIDKQLADEALRYHHVAKKYKRAQTVAHGSAISLGSFCSLLSSTGLATSLTGIGIPVGAALTGVASLFGISSACLTVASKKLEAKKKTV